jgi:hypothetical protein
VQRDAEFARIHAALVGDNKTSGIVLVGDAGVGKTTLARLVTQSLPSRVQWVAGTESARTIPLGVFAHLVSSATSRDPIAFLAAARETLLAERDSIVGVDDAHMLDQLSATLLHQLAIDGSVRIVATVRRGETLPDAITSLWKDGYLELLNLQPFTKAQCVTLIEDALGGRVEGLSADLMWEASAGNALYVRHLVEGALETGALRQVRGVWQLRGRTSVTSELASLLDARVEALPDPVMHVLRLVTFCEPLDLDVLTGMAGADPVEQAEDHRPASARGRDLQHQGPPHLRSLQDGGEARFEVRRVQRPRAEQGAQHRDVEVGPPRDQRPGCVRDSPSTAM